MRVPLDCSLSPERVLLALREEPWPFALTGRWAGGGAIVGCAPRRLLGAGDEPFEALEDLPAARGDAEVGGGWFGWLGYGLGARVENLPPRPPRPAPLPDAHLAFYDHVLRQDASGQWWFEALDGAPDRLDHLRALLAAAPEPKAPEPATFSLRAPGAAGHVASVRECVERIAAGEIFQANLCLRLDAAWDGDVADLFAQAALAPGARLRRLLPHALGRDRELLARAVPAPPGPDRDDRPDQGHGAARRRPGGTAPLGEGPRRARDDRGPDAQRPRARRLLRHASRPPPPPRPSRTPASGTSSPRSAPGSRPATATPPCCARPSRRGRSPAPPRSRRCTSSPTSKRPAARSTRARSASRAPTPASS